MSSLSYSVCGRRRSLGNIRTLGEPNEASYSVCGRRRSLGNIRTLGEPNEASHLIFDMSQMYSYKHSHEQLTVVRARGVKFKPYPPRWLIWSGGVKCFYREYKCFIFKVKEWEVIELAFVKEYNILKDGQGTCCHDLNSYHWLYRSLKTTFNSGDTSRFALTLQWCTLYESHLHYYERWPFWCKAIHCTFFFRHQLNKF